MNNFFCINIQNQKNLLFFTTNYQYINISCVAFLNVWFFCINILLFCRKQPKFTTNMPKHELSSKLIFLNVWPFCTNALLFCWKSAKIKTNKLRNFPTTESFLCAAFFHKYFILRKISKIHDFQLLNPNNYHKTS